MYMQSSLLLKRAKRLLLKRAGLLPGRKHFIPSITSNDIFLVTYPKSGTNWVGFFLACALLSKNKEREEQNLTLVTYRNYVQNVNYEYRKDKTIDSSISSTSPRIFTVHATQDPRLKRVIYLVRDPRDVLASYYFYQKRNNPSLKTSMKEFIEKSVIRKEIWPCDWAEHVADWLNNASSHDLLFLRYEDLKLNPELWFSKILQFCNIELDAAQLSEAIENSSFENMSRLESSYGMKGQSNNSEIKFMRKGRAGGWREDLDLDSVRLIQQEYGSLMRKLGYQIED